MGAMKHRPILRARSIRSVVVAPLALPLLLCAGCRDGEPVVVDTGGPARAAIADRAVDGVHDVRCGCEIEGIMTCGNFATIDGVAVPIEGLDLGPMEWCGESGVRAHLVGRVEDGVLVATSLERRP